MSVRSLALILTVLATFLMPQLSCAEVVTATVTAGNGPYAVAVNPGNNKIYVANNVFPSFTVINGLDNSTGTLPLNVPAGQIWYPTVVAVNMANNKVYVVSQVDGGNGTVTIINGDTNDLLATVTVEKMPCAVAVNLTNNKVYVANRGSDKVTVIDGGTNIPISTITVGTTPWAIAVNTQTNKIYVVNKGSKNVTVIDDNNSTTTVSVGNGPNAIAVNEDTNKIYVTNEFDNTVTVIDGATDTRDPTPVVVGTTPSAIAVNTQTNKVYVVNSGSNNVTVIDGTTNIPDVNPVAVGTSPTTVAVNPNPGYNRIFVGNRGAGTVTVIDGATNNTITAVTVGTSPWAIAVDTLTKKVYVANYSSDNVTVIPEFYSVRITPAGTGTGVVDVNSSQGVISCGTTCSASFPVGQELVLFQTPTTNSGFSGWGGASCSGTGDCAFNMLTDKDVSADFTLSPLVKNQTTGVAYNSLQTAYNEAKDNHTIRARSTLTAAGLNLNQPTNLIIAGGYDADYTNCIGLTPVLGRVNVSFAPLHVHGLAIRPAP